MAEGAPESQSESMRQRRRESSRPNNINEDINQIVTVNVGDSEMENEEEDKDSLYFRKKNQVSGSFTLMSVTILIIVVLLFTKYMDRRLPEPLMESDIVANPKRFIEERARNNLHDLTSVGIRVTGSTANDVATVNNLMDILTEIQLNSSEIYNVEMDVQRPTGGFWMDDDEGSTSSYSKIANVVAKLEPSDPSSRSNFGILLNCHFDTKPGSPGATDNMISCSVMLEILRVLSTQPSQPLTNPIIFLFNGAEELGLQGAHGFVAGKTSSTDEQSGHPWAQNLSVFMNLEGAGAGGREILFQATGGGTGRTGWLLKAYKKSMHPFGTVLAEEAFQFGLIPSDTDFRIFRDFKDLPGFDMAFIKNGYIYHTKWDKLSEIPPGSLQHMGDNALAMVEYLGSFDFSAEQNSAGEMVFYDFLGSFMISYSKTVGIVINVIISLASIGAIVVFGGWKPKNFLIYAWYLGSTIIAWGASIGVAALVAVILNGSGYPKPFYSYPSLSLILFGLPAMITQILAYSICLQSAPIDAWLAGKLTLAIILFVSTWITRGAYIFLPPLIFGMVGWFAARYLMRGWPKAIMVTYMIIGEIIPLIMSSYLIFILADVFVPILGRAGSEMNGNIFFGLIIAALITVLAVPGLVPLFVNYDRRTILTCLLMSVFLLNPMIVFGFLGKIPYQEKTPLRLTICDVDRTYYHANLTERKSEHGLWWWPLDADTDNLFPEFFKSVHEVDLVEDVSLDYENCEDLYCSQPFIWPTTDRIKKVHWIPQPGSLPPALKDRVGFRILENTSDSPTSRHISLEFNGPPQMTLVLSPQINWEAKIIIQTLVSNITVEREGAKRWKGRKVYYIYHGRGYEEEPLIINIDLDQTTTGDDNGSLLEIQQSGLFLHMTPETATYEFTDFLNRFPSWTYTGMSWSSVMKMYRIE